MPTELPQLKPGGGSTPDGRHALGAAVERLRYRRGWIIGFGVLTALLGVVALLLVETATIASVLTVGVFMMLAGIVEIVVGFRTPTWGRMVLWEAAGLLYLLAGLFAVALPELASVVLTLMLGAGLLATGLVRIVMGVRMTGSRSRGGLVVAGAITAILGVFIVVGWPGNSVLVLGTFLGIDLVFYGLSWVVFGWRLGTNDR